MIFQQEKWSPDDVFGSEYSRNQAFRHLKSQFSKALTDGFKLAKYKMGNANGYMENFISVNVANHVMKCLMTPSSWKGEAVVMSYNELTRKSFGLDFELPKYKTDDIQLFRQILLGVVQAKSPGIKTLETADPAEKEFISSMFAAMIIGIVSKIDLPALISGAIKIQVLKDSAEAAHRQSIFAQAPQLLSLREEYTEEQKKDDFTRTALSK